jgi:hypothetical protein
MINIGSRQGRKWMSLVLLLVAAFWATPTCLAQQVTPYLPGVYGMWPVDVPISSSQTQCVPTSEGALLLANKGVVGILLEVPWTSVDMGSTGPSPDFTQMNQLLTEAQLCGAARPGGLRVALSLSMPLDNQAPAGPPGLPPWVVNQITCSPPSIPCPNGMMIQETVNLGASICADPPSCSVPVVPVFWDPVFNDDQVGFIKAAADDIYNPTKDPTKLPAAAAQNIVAVLAQPFGATTDDWNIPHASDQVTAWLQAAKNSTSNPACNMSQNSTSIFACYMFGAAQTILNAAAENFPTLN